MVQNPNTYLCYPAKRQDEDYDEQVEETLQDEVNIFALRVNLQKWWWWWWCKTLQAIMVFVFSQDENDVYILTKVSDILHSVFSSYKEKVLPWFEQLLQLIVQLIVSDCWALFLVSYVHGNWKWILLNCLTCLQCPNRPWADRQWGLCIFDDVVEHCSPSSFKYAEYFLRPMIQSLCDTSPEVRQAAAYGVGVMAQFGGENYRPFCTGMTWSLLYLLAVQLFSDTYMMCSGLSSSSQRPSPCWSESSRQLTRAQRKTSTLQRTASLLWESSWGSDQSASTLTRSFPTGSAGYRSKRTKRRRSTLLTSSVTSLRGRVPRLHFPDCLWTTSTLHTWPLNPFSTATTRLSSDQRTQIFLKFSSS